MNFTSLSTSAAPLTSTPSVNSEFTFVTQTSLDIAPTTSSSAAAPSITDPDQPATTFSFASPSSAAADQRPTQAPLPSDLPLQIFPAQGSHPGDPDLQGYTQISILFDAALNWNFVAKNQKSSSQIFAWMSPILQAALNLGPSQVKTYELKYYAPSDYHGPDDVNLLQTMWLGWIPSDDVDDLAQQIKVTSSAFYTKLGGQYNQLAAHVVPSFPVTNAVVTSSDGSSSGGSNSGASSSAASSSSKTREDAIIGVVSSLGAVALLILAFLVFRAVKQRRELAHRRLSDPRETEFVGAPPEDHEFDRDSVGGQRRRSFYYAADSLRGFQDQPPMPQTSEDPFNPGMRERRPPIGAPILRDNTMNW
ncbi:hypothetical protein BV20DRAFT_946151 [Pilatotrama ljubarskyi]|nr:hypothetical protein BV20DRAFT_946151 [Pilatotrama ljubarskyi]